MTYMILEKLSAMDVPHPGIQVNASYNKYIIIVWTDFNIHNIDLVVRKGFQNQP